MKHSLIYRLQYERVIILPQNQIISSNNKFKLSNLSELHDKVPQYNCDEIKQLLAEYNFKKLEELYPDEDHKFLVTTLANDTVIISRRNCIHSKKKEINYYYIECQKVFIIESKISHDRIDYSFLECSSCRKKSSKLIK